MEQSSLVTVAMGVLWNNHPWLLWQWDCYGTIIPGYCGNGTAMEQSSLVTVAMGVLRNNHPWLLWQWECYVTIIPGYCGNGSAT